MSGVPVRRRKVKDIARSEPSLVHVPPPPNYPPPSHPPRQMPSVTYEKNFVAEGKTPKTKMPAVSVILQAVIALVLVSSVALLPSSYLLLVIIVCGLVLAALLYFLRPNFDDDFDDTDSDVVSDYSGDLESGSEVGDFESKRDLDLDSAIQCPAHSTPSPASNPTSASMSPSGRITPPVSPAE